MGMYGWALKQQDVMLYSHDELILLFKNENYIVKCPTCENVGICIAHADELGQQTLSITQSVARIVLRLFLSYVGPIVVSLFPGTDWYLQDADSPDPIIEEIAQCRIVAGVSGTPAISLVVRVEAVDGPVMTPMSSASGFFL